MQQLFARRQSLGRVGYQVNPLTKLFLILLRIAIGWHLCYEGIHKISSQGTDKPFSAEMYLRTATGPLRHRFRGMVEDFHGLARLTPENIESGWRHWQRLYMEYRAFDSSQRTLAAERLEKAVAELRNHFSDEKVKARLETYRKDADEWQSAENRPSSRFEQQSQRDQQRKLDGERRALLRPIEEMTQKLHAQTENLATEQQRIRPIPPTAWQDATRLEQANWLTMYGLLVLGGLLIAGLFSRISAFAAAAMLLSFYLAHPPWPGLPANPTAEGAYMFVDKTTVEVFALLVLATVPSGLWVGCDALVRGLVTRPLLRVGASELAK